ncbi:MAG: carbon-nitrogen hydrolase family protein [Sulfolobales archaeon]
MSEISSEDLKLTRREFQENKREDSINIAVPHIRVYHKSKRGNLSRVYDLMRRAREESNVNIFLLPSGFLYGPLTESHEYSQHGFKKYAERIPGDVTAILEELSKKFGVYIITGSILEKAGPRIFSTSIVISPFQEGVVYRYRKMTLSDNEISYLSPGREPGIVEIANLRIGILLEEDLFMPEIARVLALERTDLLIFFSKLVKKFTEVKPLVISRALENSTTVINVGGILNINGEDVVNVKTLIVRGNGSIEGESRDDGEEIFYMTIRIKDPKKRISKRVNNDVIKNLIRYMRKRKLLV